MKERSVSWMQEERLRERAQDRYSRIIFGGMGIMCNMIGVYDVYDSDTLAGILVFSVGCILEKLALDMYAKSFRETGMQNRRPSSVPSQEQDNPRVEDIITDAEAYAAFHSRILYEGYELELDAIGGKEEQERYLH